MKHKHHKIVFKDGKRIRTNELITYTVEEHAAEHKRLYEEGGHWKDYIAWQGLSGQIKTKDVIMEVYRQNGKANHHYTQSKEAINKMSTTKKGMKLTEEHKRKISLSRLGKKQPQSQKDKVRIAISKNYIIEDPKGTKYNITNLRKFAINNNLDQGNLTKVAQGKLPAHKGYKVYYI